MRLDIKRRIKMNKEPMTFEEAHVEILERTLKLISVQKTEAITGAAAANMKFQLLAQVSDRMVWFLRTYIWAEDIEDLSETISIKYPLNFKECVKCEFYKSLLRDWNYTDSLVSWLKLKFPVKYTVLSKECRLETVAKYPTFDYVPLPEEKYGPYRIQTMNHSTAPLKRDD